MEETTAARLKWKERVYLNGVDSVAIAALGTVMASEPTRGSVSLQQHRGAEDDQHKAVV